MNYEIIKASENIFWLKGNNQYDMNMLFCRYQEYYESPNEKFRGNSFTLLDFMEWYAKGHEDVFSYTIDWGGFNFPSRVIDEVIKLGIPDPNKYDAEMAAIHKKISDKAWEDYSDHYYLIGSCTAEIDPHELAHGLFYVDKGYRKEMINLIDSMPKEIKQAAVNYLYKIGYCEDVLNDEIQAYLATGTPKDLLKSFKKHRGIITSFEEVFKNYEKCK